MGLLEKANIREKGTISVEHTSVKKGTLEKKKLETDLDKINSIVLDAGDIKLKDAAAKLNIPLKKVEEFAKILNKQNLIELYYPAVGGARLRKKEAKIKSIKAKNKSINLIIFAATLVIIIIVLIIVLKRLGYIGY